VNAFLLLEQKEELDFLSDAMEGNPPVNGLIRAAVAQYLEPKFAHPGVGEGLRAIRERHKAGIQIVH
jgi:hypothetical protein